MESSTPPQVFFSPFFLFLLHIYNLRDHDQHAFNKNLGEYHLPKASIIVQTENML